jgi:hypothetical protein
MSRIAIALLSLLSASEAHAADAAPAVKLGAFVDTYYCYDFNDPPVGDRIRLYPSGNAYATQPVRNNEFNVNLAYVEAKIATEKIRGRLALQAGNSVQVNYTAETAVDQSRYGGGGGITRYLQEAYAGYQIAPRLWVDAGIYFSHIGFETWISRDNWTYTRSLMADNSPYYETGVKLSYEFSDQVSAQVHVLNGWQNINDTNPQKAVGTQINFAPNKAWTLTYNTFFGYENDGNGQPGSRIYQDFIAKYVVNDRLQIAAVFDLGLQKPSATETTNPWYTGALLARYQTSPVVAIAGRLEKFIDLHDSVIGAAPTGLNASGVSLGVDVALTPELLWRNEVRGLFAAEEVFYKHDGISSDDGFFVSSLALTL